MKKKKRSMLVSSVYSYSLQSSRKDVKFGYNMRAKYNDKKEFYWIPELQLLGNNWNCCRRLEIFLFSTSSFICLILLKLLYFICCFSPFFPAFFFFSYSYPVNRWRYWTYDSLLRNPRSFYIRLCFQHLNRLLGQCALSALLLAFHLPLFFLRHVGMLPLCFHPSSVIFFCSLFFYNTVILNE